MNLFGLSFLLFISKWSAGKGFYVIFILQHFDWVLFVISECDWMNIFKVVTSQS